ncbi:MAG: hypothetical protein RL095_1916 [Verrucomicrobiota bacterium]|jgi:hypothetical protein
MHSWLLETLGIGAMLLILFAYAGLSSGKLDAKSRLYHSLNLVGALIFVFYLSQKQAWPSVALNAVWAAIALLSLLRKP